MNRFDLICKSLIEIARVERAQSRTIYPEGTIYVQVSACPKYTYQIWHLSSKRGHLESKYAVVIPLIEVVPAYFILALESVTKEWQKKYIGDAINISMDLFRFLRVSYHPDLQTQMEIVRKMQVIDQAIEAEQAQVNLNKEAKKWFLDRMLI